MDLQLALDSAMQVLNEERVRPTTGYRKNLGYSAADSSTWERLGATLEGLSRPRIFELRKQSPRIVSETPDAYLYRGTNFDLLIAVFNQLPADIRGKFISTLLTLIERGGFCASAAGLNHFPTFQGKVSDAPLMAEFCMRTGYLRELLEATSKLKIPTVGMAIMMMQIEETIALNFNFLSFEILGEIPALLKPLREMADLQTHSARGPHTGKKTPNPHYKPGREKEANRIVASIDGIEAECRQARYFYLKGTLQQKMNLEVESDKRLLIGYLQSLGFGSILQQALEAAEKQYRDDATPFELKSCVGHLRSFLEHLHRESAKAIARAAGDSVADKWGASTLYLRQKGFFTTDHETFNTALYTMMSDKSVHPLGTKREYARLLRNVVIEYGVMFLSVLSEKGVKIS